ncbi:sucrase ferredoxin [Geodermatophilus sp. DSM 44513]|uniref:sucrase ferredoxin n=1 Tax=Geodermatophilus sp. DSM 44513 TaxID=1528104 RepID=UPI00126CE8A7|nr:sucrase ferredoxin [Geodermatophilus sp. DSM 44513]WNV77337.1 sucrase ferredoxin [Geodermatophilus sp. DSM 44513]
MTAPADFCRVPAAPGLPEGRLTEDRCSVQALVRGDAGVATASPAQRWLLVEQPGPWGTDALTQSRFDPAVAPRLAHRARAEGVRVLLIRRPGDRLADSQRRWAYVDGRSGVEGVWWSVRGSDADLVDAPWDGSVGERADGPVYLVCAHGAHDACCALRGRPLARTLPAEDVWECSHLGGCRFAGNVLVLPHGFAYGQLPGDGAELVAAHAAGRVALPWLRGRSGLAAPVQAAQHTARAELALYGVDDLRPRDVRRLTPAGVDVERWVVTLAGPDGDVVTEVESRPSEQAAPLTCRATHPAHSRTWHVRLLSGL